MTTTVHIKNDGPKSVVLKRYEHGTANVSGRFSEQPVKVLLPKQGTIEVVWKTSSLLIQEIE